jgi:parallel beta-helix repeat protein
MSNKKALIILGLALTNSFSFLTPIPVLAQNSQNNYRVLYVSPSWGIDNNNGQEKTPLKTITQALNLAKKNTVIILQNGIYSIASGEVFPLILKPNVRLQGNPNTRGQDIIIKGGGTYISPTAAQQNITILAGNQSLLSGVTITNPNERGYGLWIESTNPIIENNTFTSSDHDGISVNGNSQAIIKHNSIYQNRGNGITIYGTSSPEIAENVFNNTGFGISIAQKATPRIISNQIINNKDGVVVEGQSKPILRGNFIGNNQRDGVVAISKSFPDLGTNNEPGNNRFSNNGRFDISNKTNNQTLTAIGNQLTNQIQGKFTLIAAKKPLILSSNNENNQPQIFTPTPPLPTVNIDIKAPEIEPTKPLQLPLSPPEINIPIPVTINKSIPNNVIVPVTINPTTKSNLTTANVTINTPAVVIPAPPQNTELPVLNSNPIAKSISRDQVPDILPVPTAKIPVGNIGKNTNTISVNNLPLPNNSTIPKTPLVNQNFTATNQVNKLRYRLLVMSNNSLDEARVKSIIPDGFHTFYQGRKVLQVGAYNNIFMAEEMQKKLRLQGINAMVAGN